MGPCGICKGHGFFNTMKRDANRCPNRCNDSGWRMAEAMRQARERLALKAQPAQEVNCPLCQRGEPCAANLEFALKAKDEQIATLEAEVERLKAEKNAFQGALLLSRTECLKLRQEQERDAILARDITLTNARRGEKGGA